MFVQRTFYFHNSTGPLYCFLTKSASSYIDTFKTEDIPLFSWSTFPKYQSSMQS